MDNYHIREIADEEFGTLWLGPSKKFFEDESQVFRLRMALSEEELATWETLRAKLGNPIRINLGMYNGDEFIGWCWGYQESAMKFYMCNSAIFPEHRRKGLYTRLLNEMISRTKALGFQEVFSRHAATNNSIIIPKLKAGFKITTLEVSDLFGVCVHLNYYLNPLRTKILDYRVGQIKPDDEIRKNLGI